MAAKKLALKQTSNGAAGTGVVERISTEAEESGESARITIRHGPKPRRRKDGGLVSDYSETTHLTIPVAMARSLKVGQRVRVRVEPV